MVQKLSWRILFLEQVKFLKSSFWFQLYNASSKDTFFYSSGTPDQVGLIQLVKFFLPVRPNFAWRFNSMFDNPQNPAAKSCADGRVCKIFLASLKLVENL